MNERPISSRGTALVAIALTLLIVVRLAGQAAAPLTLLSKEGRRTLPVTMVGTQEFVALDDLAAAFQLVVREESGAITVSYRARTIVLTPEQTLASVAGRLISLPAGPVRAGGRWHVPLEFISRALAPVHETPIELRRPSRLVIVGDVRAPRVSIRHEALPNAARLTLDATPRAAASVTQDDGRLLIKYEADVLDVAIPPVQPGLVQAIRILDSVTLAVDLGPRFAGFRSSTQSVDSSARLVIDLVSAPVETTGPTPAPALPPAPGELPIFGGTVATIRTIAIDPGHGGDNAGVLGPGGTREKNLTLDVATRLKAVIEGRLGIRVLLTRDEDREVPIDERSAMANNNKADLFLSLHANASFRPSTTGISIFVAALGEVAQDAEKPVPERVPIFGGGSRDIELLPWDLAQIRHLEDSTALATILEEQLRNGVRLEVRTVERAPLRVLESANMPAVLIEMGYLTNVDQEKMLNSSDFKNTFVQSVYESILRFRDHLTATGGDR